MNKKIIVVGSINTDMVVRSPQIPTPGQTLMGHSFITTGGGKGANQAVAAARLGGSVVLIGKVGDDNFGNIAKENFQKEGIDISFISTDEKEPSGAAFIIVDDKGENIIVVAQGANARLTNEDIIHAEEEIKKCSVILFQLEIPLETVEAGMKLARQYNKTVILNPAPAAELSDELLSYVNIIVPNQPEAFTLTGITVNNNETAAIAANAIHAKGIETVIITMGELGAYISSPNYRGMIPGFQAGKVVDTVAAGDTFCGALTIALAEGKNVEDAARCANVAAALSVTKQGAQASIPHRKDVDDLLR